MKNPVLQSQTMVSEDKDPSARQNSTDTNIYVLATQLLLLVVSNRKRRVYLSL